MPTIAERVAADHSVVEEDQAWFEGCLGRVEREVRMECDALLRSVRDDLAAQGATAEGLPGVLPQTLYRIAQALDA